MQIELASVRFNERLSASELSELDARLRLKGLSILWERKTGLAEMIKLAMIRYINENEPGEHHRISDYLTRALHYNYDYLSGLFSAVFGSTIEHYLITSRIERVKELLLYQDLTLKDIAWKLQFSSVAHLSAQFKKETGLSPTAYKKMIACNLIRRIEGII